MSLDDAIKRSMGLSNKLIKGENKMKQIKTNEITGNFINEAVEGKLFINNVWVDAFNNETFEVINPATEEVIANVAQGGEADVDLAVAAARAAFEGWSKTPHRERAKFLFKIAEKLTLYKEAFARIETIDNGKPISETLNADLPLAIECFEYYGALAYRGIGGKTIPIKEGFTNSTFREPIGVIGQIIPWNFPLLMLAWKVAPALATGNPVVLKPAEQTPLSALEFAKILVEIGLPKGVVNIVTGDGTTGEFIVKHPDVDKIAFTGSTEVGKLISATAGLKRVSLELGGKAPNIVFADSNINDAVQGAITSIFFNQGEVCCAGSRLFVEESIKGEFVDKLKNATESLVQGDPLDPKTQIGAQISKEQFAKILDYIERGILEGAKLITGNTYSTKKGDGLFIRPTILEATDDNICAREEIFGPVVTILTFKDEADVIKRANDTNYGLSAGIWTRDIGKANRVAAAIRAGTIWINCYNVFDAASPFGGYKDSGHGRELGEYALDLYTEVKSVITSKE